MFHHEIGFMSAKARTVSFPVENSYHGGNLRILYNTIFRESFGMK